MPNTNVPGQIVQKAPVTLTGNVLPTTTTTSPTAPVTPLIVTHFQFRKLFTFTERVAIDNAQYNLTLSGSQKAAINTMQQDLNAALDVDLHMVDTINGIGYLVSCGILTADRAARILGNLPPL